MNISPLARLFASTIADDTQPSDGVKRSSCNYGNWWRAAVMGACCSAYRRSDKPSLPRLHLRGWWTPTLEIPGGTGNFIFFTDPFTTTSVDGRPAASIENGIVVFSGSGPSGQKGHLCRRSWGSDNNNC